jgi:predicted DNA binding protein
LSREGANAFPIRAAVGSNPTTGDELTTFKCLGRERTRTSMVAGIRTTVRFPDATVCPISQFATEADSSIGDVTHSVAADGEAPVTEFTAPSDADPPPAFEAVISYGASTRYRLVHDADCPCVCLGEFGCPLDRYLAEDGTLTLSFHAPAFDRLQTIVGTLQERFPAVDIKRMVRSPAESDRDDAVFVDRGKLTDRQRETLATAYEMGYFERPREANAGEVAAELDISPTTFAEHLAAAQSKLLGDVFEGR